MRISWLFLVWLIGLLPLAAQVECIKGDCVNGYGTCIFPGGSRYVGDFLNGQLHGRGILYYPDGSKYIGHWERQHRSGEGRLVLADGGEYLGMFSESRFHGQGKMTYANGNVYEGEWYRGEPQGQGDLHFANGDHYIGQFEQGRARGQGTMYYADGSRYEGEWQGNLRHGLGTMYYPDGESVSGQWEQDQYLADWGRLAFAGDTASLRNCNTLLCQSGKGKFTYGDGSKYIGDFYNGQPEGVGTVYYANGNRYEGGWQRHAPHGKGVMFYTNGKIVGAIWDYGRPVRQLFADQVEAPGAITVEEDPDVRVWAVIVGAARYTHMPVLRYTDDDAYQLYAFLKSPEGGALPDGQIQLLIDEDATHRNILNAMRSIFLRADHNDMVLFYFSGHGLPGAFLPVDYDGYANRLEHTEISEILQASRAKHKLVLADACHSGGLLAARTTAHLALQRYYEALHNSSGGTALLLSSKGEEYSLEDGGLRSGIFSHFLIEGLKGAADTNSDRLVTIRELFNFVHRQVRTYTGNIQTPTLTGQFDEQMPVGVLR
jgi:hypothetical protein